VVRDLRQLADADIAAHSARFFKTGPGQYGEGDRFLGIRVPEVRRIARRYSDGAGSGEAEGVLPLSLPETVKLLHSPLHEVRHCALLIMVRQFESRASADKDRKAIYEAYLANTAFINNWDLVDCSAYQVVGGWLRNRSRKPLYRLAASASLWERRIAMMSTWCFIREGQFDDTMTLAELLLDDPEDLIHKVSGWMLREVAKRDPETVVEFLRAHHSRVPRTMLRYAIERFPQAQRKRILRGKF
jgi:hypothetical protein